MKENKNDIDNQDQDYGFPFVELVPLNQQPKEELEKSEVNEIKEVPQKEVLDQPSTIISKSSEENKDSQVQIDKKKSDDESGTGVKKKSSSSIIFILTLLIFLILGSMAYFLYYQPNLDNTQSQEAYETEIEIDANEELASVENSENESESILEEIEDAVEVIPEPELTIIESREASPRYFIVVGSVVAERYAREEVKQYLENGHDTWIIFPYGDIRNYRIAVGKFDNIEAATEAWEKAKSEFGDAIWILKY